VTIHDRHSKAQSHVCAGCLRCLKTEWRGGLPWTLLALGVGGLAATVLVDRLGGRWKWVVGVPFVAVCGGPLMATAISRLISGCVYRYDRNESGGWYGKGGLKVVCYK
jgi:hypothetical protein